MVSATACGLRLNFPENNRLANFESSTLPIRVRLAVRFFSVFAIITTLALLSSCLWIWSIGAFWSSRRTNSTNVCVEFAGFSRFALQMNLPNRNVAPSPSMT